MFLRLYACFIFELHLESLKSHDGGVVDVILGAGDALHGLRALATRHLQPGIHQLAQDRHTGQLPEATPRMSVGAADAAAHGMVALEAALDVGGELEAEADLGLVPELVLLQVLSLDVETVAPVVGEDDTAAVIDRREDLHLLPLRPVATVSPALGVLGADEEVAVPLGARTVADGEAADEGDDLDLRLVQRDRRPHEGHDPRPRRPLVPIRGLHLLPPLVHVGCLALVHLAQPVRDGPDIHVPPRLILLVVLPVVDALDHVRAHPHQVVGLHRLEHQHLRQSHCDYFSP